MAPALRALLFGGLGMAGVSWLATQYPEVKSAMGLKNEEGMAPVYKKVPGAFSELIGGTPIVRLDSLSEATGCEILAKAEFMSPGGSIKDRAAKYLVEDAIRRGALKPGSGTIIEASGGNTGIGLAHAAHEHDLKCIVIVPDKIEKEKVTMMRALGSEVIITATVGYDDPRNYLNVARKKEQEIPGSCFINQCDNLANAAAHFDTTAPEIWRQTRGKMDGFVCTPGTGGTLAGCSRYFKMSKPGLPVWLVEPIGQGIVPDAIMETREGSVIHFRDKTKAELADKVSMKGDSVVDGVGLGKVYANVNGSRVDGIMQLENDVAALLMGRYLTWTQGLFVGGSSGMNALGAYCLAKIMGPGHTIVTVLPDSGCRYTSTIYDDNFLKKKKLPTTEDWAKMIEGKTHAEVLQEITKEFPKLITVKDLEEKNYPRVRAPTYEAKPESN